MPKAKQVDDPSLADIGEQMRSGFARLGQRIDALQTEPKPEPEREERMGAWKWPRQMNMATFTNAVPGLFSEWDGFRRAVPEDFVSVDADEDGAPIAVVACPCGESPVVPHLGIRACNCRRVFASIGRGEIRAWRPPALTDEEYAPD